MHCLTSVIGLTWINTSLFTQSLPPCVHPVSPSLLSSMRRKCDRHTRPDVPDWNRSTETFSLPQWASQPASPVPTLTWLASPEETATATPQKSPRCNFIVKTSRMINTCCIFILQNCCWVGKRPVLVCGRYLCFITSYLLHTIIYRQHTPVDITTAPLINLYYWTMIHDNHSTPMVNLHHWTMTLQAWSIYTFADSFVYILTAFRQAFVYIPW